MGLLDTNVPAMVSAGNSFGQNVAIYKSTLAAAEQSAQAAQAFHKGDSAMAFQAAHARFVESANKVNALLAIAEQNVHEGATTYTTADSSAAGEYVM